MELLLLDDVGTLLLELGVTGLTVFDNTKGESRRVSAVRGDNAGDGIGAGGMPYGCGWRP